MLIRSARAAAAHFKKCDPETCITEAYIRRLMLEGDIPAFKNGNKWLTSIEAIEEYIQRQLGGN